MVYKSEKLATHPTFQLKLHLQSLFGSDQENARFSRPKHIIIGSLVNSNEQKNYKYVQLVNIHKQINYFFWVTKASQLTIESKVPKFFNEYIPWKLFRDYLVPNLIIQLHQTK